MRVNIEYKSSHKIRRGHGVVAVKHSKNYEEFQAYSQNMGHEDPGTTFKYYSKLTKNDVRDVILKNRQFQKQRINLNQILNIQLLSKIFRLCYLYT